MISDKELLLALAEVIPNGGAPAAAGTTPGAIGFGSNSISKDSDGVNREPLDPSGITDLLRANSNAGAGQELLLQFRIVSQLTCATFGATMEIQLISLPIRSGKRAESPAQFTPPRPSLSDAATTGKLLVITGVTLDVGTDQVSGGTNNGTLNNHDLPVGTPVFLTSITGVTGGAIASTIYYVVPDTANTFKLASTLPLALAGNADVNMIGSNGTATLNFIPTVHASTGTLPLFNAPTNKGPWRANERIHVPLRPLSAMTPLQLQALGQTRQQTAGAGPGAHLLAANAQRYFYLRYLPSHPITAGTMSCRMVVGSDDALNFRPVGYKVVG